MRHWVVIAVALAIGLFMLSVDRRTDDTGIEVVLVLASALILTLASPRAAIAVALAIGLPMALLNGSLPGLVVSSVGAAVGYGVRASASATRPG